MTNDTITRSEAIDRMKAGLPCETFCPGWGENDGWDATKWADFDDEDSECKFRIPPAPRRVARVFQIVWRDGAYHVSIPNYDGGTVREVLPGDVTLQPMTEDQVFQLAKQSEVSTPVAERICRALGLIGEGS